VRQLAERVGVSLGDEQTADARTSGLGALLSYVTGVGVLYGAGAPVLARLPRPLSAVLVGACAMAATDAGSAWLGSTDPRSWGPQDWLADIVPHLAYGAVMAGPAATRVGEVTGAGRARRRCGCA
jgi:hypothetical protein